MKPVLDQLERNGDLATRPDSIFGYEQKRTFAKRLADLSKFSPQEVGLIHEVVARFWRTSATDISDLSHEFVG